MDKKDELVFIATNPDQYLQTTGKTLEARLSQIQLSKKDIGEIKKEQGGKMLREKGLALFGPIGEIANTVINWNEEVSKDISDAKKMVLLEEYFNKSDSMEQEIEKLTHFLTNPLGNTLFNKILRIVDDSPPDPELTQHLATV
ncbi:hypothetical protein DFO70_11779 [Cytobacillus firmus]|uniref:Uncharacterized protein n=2 Tax=Cytobacillus TaxID=2675230 RepID=A0A366JKG8_CYTFI|nr:MULTISPECIES: hypothetical protein [Cytobacillus]RBP87888.1 hypothetical protein DFO70_11779 [Cytobacillus firmus]TDX39251.1 hypothetical protein DFO72_11181 [Cytobacillus oceanisediminis]